MSDKQRLEPQRVSRALAGLEGWSLTADGLAIEKEFVFDDFVSAFAFMTAVALVAERRNHHPDWSNSYKRVHIRLTSHDVAGLTERDISLAAAIDKVVTSK